MNDINILKDAIRSVGKYTINQQRILDELIDLSIGGVSVVTIAELAKRTSIPRPTIYAAIGVFIRDGIIRKEFHDLGGYKFQQEKVDFLIELHQKKH